MIVIGIDPSLTALGISTGASHSVLQALAPLDGEERAASTKRRTFGLAMAVAGWVAERLPPTVDDLHIYVEAPLLAAQGANHLYELGWLMSALYAELESSFSAVRIFEVPTATVRKFVSGKGNTPKAQFPLAIYKRFGIEFEKDRGADMAFAFALQRYGEACERGEVERVVSARRGQGTKDKARQAGVARRSAAA